MNNVKNRTVGIPIGGIMRPTISESVDKLCKSWEKLSVRIADEIGDDMPVMIEKQVAESFHNFSENIEELLTSGKEYVELKKDISRTIYMLISLMGIHGISIADISIEMSNLSDRLNLIMEEEYGSTRKE